jgi:hypothetical protein
MRRYSVGALVVLLSLPALAFIGDSAEHAPPSSGAFAYNSFIPAPGASYVDPVFNETVRRLTSDGSQDDLYARNMWWNATGTRLLHRSQAGGSDRWRVIDVATGAVTHDDIPFGSVAGDGGFDPVDPDVLYSVIDDNGSGRGELRKITLGPGGTWTPQVYFTAPAPIHQLGGTINWLDATGRYMVVRYGAEPSVYVYDRSNLGAGPYANPVDGSDTIDRNAYLGITPDGKYLVGYDNLRGQGVSWAIDHANRVVAPTPRRFWSLCGDHGSFISASDGRDYMVTFDCNDAPEIWRADVSNHIIDDNGNVMSPAAQKALPHNARLLALATWNDVGHFSTAAHGNWAFLGTYDGGDQFNGPTTPWWPYRQEIIALDTVTFEVRRLAHHRSRSPFSDYYSKPRVSASWTGNVVGFASNFNQPGGGTPVVDVYAVPFSGAGAAGGTGGAGGSGGTGGAVDWVDPVNVAITGQGSIEKQTGCDGCADAGARSAQQIASGSGFFEFTVGQTGPLLFVGLTDSFTYTEPTSIDFAIRLQSTFAEVRENGTYRTDTPAAQGDVFRIAVDGNAVTYYKNGIAFYTSTAPPAYPLSVGASLASLNATVNAAQLTAP